MSQQALVRSASREAKPLDPDCEAILQALHRYQEVEKPWTGDYEGIEETELLYRSGLPVEPFRNAIETLLLRDPRVILAGVGRYQLTW